MHEGHESLEMIEEAIFGILIVVFGLGAFLSARKMSLGPVFYYGKTLPKRTASRRVGENESEREAIETAKALVEVAKLMVLAAELGDEFSSPELVRYLSLALRDEYPARLVLAKLEAKAQARKIRDRARETIPGAVESRKWKDDIEGRLRALEEKSAAEEKLALAAENPDVPDVQRIH